MMMINLIRQSWFVEQKPDSEDLTDTTTHVDIINLPMLCSLCPELSTLVLRSQQESRRTT
ncbi:unnamed protein product [Arabidopsis lyrata]|nr:unnamed protein product [Arabidopsis lyrata]